MEVVIVLELEVRNMYARSPSWSRDILCGFIYSFLAFERGK
jgi:hypothetical protein